MIREITVQEVARKLSEGERMLLVDVREPEEYAIAALPASILMPMNELPQRWNELERESGAEIVVYCHHGVRSRRAASFLSQCGLEAISLAGGIDAWSRLVDPKVPRY